MADYITIDGGTTNTRISLLKDLQVADTLRISRGAGAGVNEKSLLRTAVKDGIQELLKRNGAEEKDIERILASGMITSASGLCELPHIPAPAGIKELHDSMEERELPDVCSVPFVFIRGVKTQSTDLDTADMMRGEETELMGIWEEGGGECVYILPGSHSKMIRTDESGRITDFSTMMTGEMTAALSKNTILKDAFSLEDSVLEKDPLLQGFDCCERLGFNRALFKTRVIRTLMGESESRAYSFFMGVMLCGELLEIIRADPPKVTLGGRKQIKEAAYILLREKLGDKVSAVPDEKASAAPALGAVRVYEYRAVKR